MCQECEEDCICPRKCLCEFKDGELVGIDDLCPEHGDDCAEASGYAPGFCPAQKHWWEE